MRLQSMSTRKISKIMTVALEKGSYSVPHIIYDLSLNNADQSVLCILFKLQDDYVRKSKDYWGWFFCKNERLVKLTKLSWSTVKRSRRRLKYKGLIDYRLGNMCCRKATEFRILIDPFYVKYYGNNKGSDVLHTKTKASN